MEMSQDVGTRHFEAVGAHVPAKGGVVNAGSDRNGDHEGKEMEMETGDGRDSENGEHQSESGKWQCPHCDLAFDSPTAYGGHVRIHSKEFGSGKKARKRRKSNVL